MKLLQKITLGTLCAGTLLACGSGGGSSDEGDNFIGASKVTITNSPNEIDTGDRTQVKIKISNLHENGVLLKVLYPEGLFYVSGSSSIVHEGDDETKGKDLSPASNPTGDDGTFLLYFLDKGDIKKDETATILFELEGASDVKDGIIEVDSDVNDPLISDNNEFDIENPEFLAESSSTIKVIE